MQPDGQFKERVLAIVAQIPKGKVMSYGQIAAMAGHPYAAKIVGGIAHFGDSKLPWQRVIKQDGSLAEGYPGGVMGHKAALEAEGVMVNDELKVDIERLRWTPEAPGQASLL